MELKMRSLTRWSAAPAKDVETAVSPKVNVLRGLAARATTPLLPDDYLNLLNPLWSARELRGVVVDVRKETEHSATVSIKPGWGFSGDYRPGQYLGIGLRVDGRWHWRSYSLTSIPRRDKKLLSITVKATPEGFLSSHLVNGVEAGTVVRLATPKGDFSLPDPAPGKLLFVTAGSGITPVIAMLRSLKHRGESTDIMHIHSAPVIDEVIFHDELRALERAQPGYRLHLQLTADMGKVDFAALDGLVPDWKDRSTWACGPTAMLDTVEKVWTDAGIAHSLHMERFTIPHRQRRRGRHGHLQDLRQVHRTRRRHVAVRRWREARHPDAVRLPNGHLPILRTAAGIGLRARSEVRNRAPRGRSNPDAHLRRFRRLHHKHLGGPHGYN
jgi:stearoyl-CoA 9-desaturase NADPH oxidoreductase